MHHYCIAIYTRRHTYPSTFVLLRYEFMNMCMHLCACVFLLTRINTVEKRETNELNYPRHYDAYNINPISSMSVVTVRAKCLDEINFTDFD